MVRSYILTARERLIFTNYIQGAELSKGEENNFKVSYGKAVKALSSLREDLELIESVRRRLEKN